MNIITTFVFINYIFFYEKNKNIHLEKIYSKNWD